jgi:hypothetical protein
VTFVWGFYKNESDEKEVSIFKIEILKKEVLILEDTLIIE